MKVLGRFLVLLVSVLVLAGCGLHLYNPNVSMDEYPYRHNDFDYTYIWKTGATDKGLVVEGFVKNVRYAYIDRVEITLSVLDKNGKVVHKVSDIPMPQQSQQGDLCSFTLLFKNYKLAPGDVFLFHLRYTSDDGDKSGFTWDSSFKVDAGSVRLSARKQLHWNSWACYTNPPPRDKGEGLFMGY